MLDPPRELLARAELPFIDLELALDDALRFPPRSPAPPDEERFAPPELRSLGFAPAWPLFPEFT
jgi:hypothetical protein